VVNQNGCIKRNWVFFAILVLIGGAVLLIVSPFLGIPLIIGAIIWMWFLHKGGQVTSMQKDLKALRKLQEENQHREVDKEMNEALKKKDALDGASK
jgi:hypothetical protein